MALLTVEDVQAADRTLRPLRALWWISYYLALLFSFLFLVPWASYLMMHYRFLKESRKPNYQDLIAQMDDWIPLSILFLCMLAFSFLAGLPVLVIRLFFSLIHPWIGGFVAYAALLVIASLAWPVFTYATIEICERKTNAVDAIKKSLGLLVVDLKRDFVMGLCVTIGSLPCGILAPLGFHLLIKHYLRKISP